MTDYEVLGMDEASLRTFLIFVPLMILVMGIVVAAAMIWSRSTEAGRQRRRRRDRRHRRRASRPQRSLTTLPSEQGQTASDKASGETLPASSSDASRALSSRQARDAETHKQTR